MGFEPRDDEPSLHVDPFVESQDWSAPISCAPVSSCPAWFVDGVRRVELRLVAADGAARAPGLFGSYAVGAVHCERRAVFASHHVSRAVVLGGGLMPERVDIGVGASTLSFEATSDPSLDPNRPLWRLQQLMRRAEASLAARLAHGGDLVLADGPLTFSDPTQAPVVGLVKRFVRHYLAPPQEALLAALGVGDRTPLFALGEPGGPVERYAWYARLAGFQRHWHDHAGVVRCEVSANVGIEAALGLAGRVSGMLPAYAGKPTDPRTPQNLTVVAGLEGWLRHRMGAQAMVRRALVAWLAGREDT